MSKQSPNPATHDPSTDKRVLENNNIGNLIYLVVFTLIRGVVVYVFFKCVGSRHAKFGCNFFVAIIGN